MNTDASPAPRPSSPDGLSRRTVVATAAWAVPAVVLTTASPAFAASGTKITLSTPDNRVLAKGKTDATAHVTDGAGTAESGKSVSFSGPANTSFSPTSATTDGSGDAKSTLTTDDQWATPGSTMTISATTDGANTSTGLTVIGANAYGVGNNSSSFLGIDTDSNNTDGQGRTRTPTQLSLVFDSPIVQIVSQGAGAFALLKDGTVWAIGSNSRGQLADGTTNSRSTWAKIEGLSDVKQIAGGWMAGYALMPNGQIKAWGNNEYGQLGDGTTTERHAPVTVKNITTATQIAGGRDIAYALLSDGAVQSWGDNQYSQLGRTPNAGNPAVLPGTVENLSGATQLSAGDQAGYALVSGGGARSWGRNANGQLGDGTTTDSARAVTVSGISNAKQISGGGTSAYALLSDRTVRAWGNNNRGQLGDGNGGNGNSSTTPVTVRGLTNVSAIAGGAWAGYALLSDGAGVRAWGRNQWGELGDGTNTERHAPVAVQNVSNVTALGVGASVPGNSPSCRAYFIR